MATKKTAKKAQPKASPKKAPAPKPSTAKKTASKVSRASAPGAKTSAKAKAPLKKRETPPPAQGSKAKVKTPVAKKATPKVSAETKKATKKITSKASPKAKASPAKNARATSESATEAALESTANARVDVGDAAPSFVLKDDTGAVVSSETLRGSPYVLYFYPKDDTPGCTLEACGFRDSLPRFNAKGVRVIGVSPDSPEAHTKFKKKYDLSFPLLSDPEKTLAQAYGVWVKKQNYGREYMGVERSTFVIDKHGTVEQVWRGVKVPGHVDAVLDSV